MLRSALRRLPEAVALLMWPSVAVVLRVAVAVVDILRLPLVCSPTCSERVSLLPVVCVLLRCSSLLPVPAV